MLDEIDIGEAEAIVYMLESEGDLLLMDEKKGREVAKRFGLTTMGILGILLRSKTLKIIREVKPIMDRLIQEARFYIADPLCRDILKLADEQSS